MNLAPPKPAAPTQPGGRSQPERPRVDSGKKPQFGEADRGLASSTRKATNSVTRSPRRRRGVLLFLSTFSAYTAIGMVLSLYYNHIDGDGPSRVANAAYVLFSRDPHLAAIGFVWNPLPSLVELPILLFNGIWPALLTRGQAGTLMSAAFMAGAVWQIWAISIERGLPRFWHWIILVGFACNPMIVIYGGNGLSEAPYLFFTLWAARRLLRWMRSDQVTDLVVAGIALGLDYLTRYEAAAAAAAVVGAVVVVAVLRSGAHDRTERFKRGVVDGTVLAFPFAICFIGWTVASWLTTGIAFAQFGSLYGNTSQLSAVGTSIPNYQKHAGGAIAIVVRDILNLEPLLPVVIIIVMVLAVRRIDLDSLIPIALFGGILLFEAVGQLSGSTFPWFRFFLTTVPLMVVLITLIWPYHGNSSLPNTVPSLSQSKISERVRWVMQRPVISSIQRSLRGLTLTSRKGVVLSGLGIALLLAPSIPVTWNAMLNPEISTQPELYGLRSVVSSLSTRPSLANSNWYMASYLDRLHLPDGSVIMDTFNGWEVWLDSQHKKQFVITSDYDFTSALNAPVQHGIQYILVSEPSQDGGADAINQRYPTLYATGAGIASLVMTVPRTSVDKSTWRLYRVNPLP
jgi:hypothetical protein